jgi:hypothetical protein
MTYEENLIFFFISFSIDYLGMLLDRDKNLGADPDRPLVVDVQQPHLPTRGPPAILHPHYLCTTCKQLIRGAFIGFLACMVL